jgi:hypothetical protein
MPRPSDVNAHGRSAIVNRMSARAVDGENRLMTARWNWMLGLFACTVLLLEFTGRDISASAAEIAAAAWPVPTDGGMRGM